MVWSHIGGNGCGDVNQQELATVKAELAAVKAEMAAKVELIAVRADLQGRVDMLQSQLNYWLNVKDSSNSGDICKLTQRYYHMYVVIHVANKLTLHTALSGDCEVGDTNLELNILSNITETSKHTYVFTYMEYG